VELVEDEELVVDILEEDEVEEGEEVAVFVEDEVEVT
jgi:hypothetical protein